MRGRRDGGLLRFQREHVAQLQGFSLDAGECALQFPAGKGTLKFPKLTRCVRLWDHLHGESCEYLLAQHSPYFLALGIHVHRFHLCPPRRRQRKFTLWPGYDDEQMPPFWLGLEMGIGGNCSRLYHGEQITQVAGYFMSAQVRGSCSPSSLKNTAPRNPMLFARATFCASACASLHETKRRTELEVLAFAST